MSRPCVRRDRPANRPRDPVPADRENAAAGPDRPRPAARAGRGRRRPDSRVTVADVLARYMAVAELEPSTRETYGGYIRRTILPALGSMELRKVRGPVLDTFYARLRRADPVGMSTSCRRASRQGRSSASYRAPGASLAAQRIASAPPGTRHSQPRFRRSSRSWRTSLPCLTVRPPVAPSISCLDSRRSRAEGPASGPGRSREPNPVHGTAVRESRGRAPGSPGRSNPEG